MRAAADVERYPSGASSPTSGVIAVAPVGDRFEQRQIRRFYRLCATAIFG